MGVIILFAVVIFLLIAIFYVIYLLEVEKGRVAVRNVIIGMYYKKYGPLEER